nr:pantoate--beta-alanine ligase [Cytophagales bacterium]
MDIIKRIPALKAVLRPFGGAKKRIGLVPTMGALHDGHMALVRNSKAQNDLTVVTIFVNPTQFNTTEDLNNYPKSLDDDLALLGSAGVDIVFVPEVEEMYPHSAKVSIHFSGLDEILEGKYRPGHFSGVALIVAKLFHLVLPDTAYFGQKDLQQVSVIKQLVADLHFDVEIITVPSVREKDGLALSSRNRRLSASERAEAVILYQILAFAKTELLDGASWFDIKVKATSIISQNNLVRIEYLELVNCQDFTLASEVDSEIPQAICVAAYVGEIRLIDNVLLT